MAGDSWPALPADTASTQWAAIVLLTALLLAVVVLLQTATSYARAYSAAPLEITSFLDAVDYSVQENETYDLDISRARRLDDKVRLSRLLREIQRAGDDLREDISRLLISETDPRLRISARLLWASKRRGLEERVRRLDMLRMRFLVVYMGILSAHALGGDKDGRSRGSGEKETKYIPPAPPLRPEALPRALTLPPPKKAAPTRRITTDAIGHSNTPAKNHKQGWAGVVEELRRSPLMHKRHASIETAMSDQRSS